MVHLQERRSGRGVLLWLSAALVGCASGASSGEVAPLLDAVEDPGPGVGSPAEVSPGLDRGLDRSPDVGNADGLTPLPCAPTCDDDALFRANQWRAWLDLSLLSIDERLQEAAAAHTTYYLHHYPDLFEAAGRSAHEEAPGTDGYTGLDPWIRMAAAGYEGLPVGEVMAFQSDPSRAVDDWIGSLYHRVALLVPVASHVGYGGANRDGRVCQTLDIGAPTDLQLEGAATLTSADLTFADFTLAEMPGANFDGCDVKGTVFLDTNMSGAAFTESTSFINTFFGGSDLSGANMGNVNLQGLDLSGANMSNANLAYAILMGSHFVDTDLSGATLHEADLHFADLTDADLSDATLSNTHGLDNRDLTVMTFAPASVQNTNLTGSDLTGLVGCDNRARLGSQVA